MRLSGRGRLGIVGAGCLTLDFPAPDGPEAPPEEGTNRHKANITGTIAGTTSTAPSLSVPGIGWPSPGSAQLLSVNLIPPDLHRLQKSKQPPALVGIQTSASRCSSPRFMARSHRCTRAHATKSANVQSATAQSLISFWGVFLGVDASPSAATTVFEEGRFLVRCLKAQTTHHPNGRSGSVSKHEAI